MTTHADLLPEQSPTASDTPVMPVGIGHQVQVLNRSSATGRRVWSRFTWKVVAIEPANLDRGEIYVLESIHGRAGRRQRRSRRQIRPVSHARWVA